jgi:copper chaperone
MNHLFTVTGMTCGHCEKAVTAAIVRLDPQAKVEIERSANKVQVQSEQSHEALAAVIVEEGYALIG